MTTISKLWGLFYKIIRQSIPLLKRCYLPVYLLYKKAWEVQDGFALTAVYFRYDWFLTAKNVTWIFINSLYLLDYRIWWDLIIVNQKNFFFFCLWDQWCSISQFISWETERNSSDHDDFINTGDIKRLDVWWDFLRYDRGPRLVVYWEALRDKLWRCQIYYISENETP